MTVELSPATPEDMVAELERRRCAVALVLAHVPAQDYVPFPDVPPRDRVKVCAGSLAARHPAFQAALLCDGIQLCLDEIADPVRVGLASELSLLTRELKTKLRELLPHAGPPPSPEDEPDFPP